MAKQAHLQAIISAVDRLSPTLSKIGLSTAKTKALMGALNGTSFARLRGGLNVIHKGVADVGGAVQNAASKLLPLVGLGALSFAGLGFGFLAASRGAMTYSAGIQDAVDVTGVGFEELQRLQGAFRMGGMEAEAANDAIVKFNKGMADGAAGKDKGFAGLMNRLRIPMRNAKGEIRSLTDVLPDLADAIEKNDNPAVRTRMLMELFGKSGSKLAGTLGQGGKSLRAVMEDLQGSGRILSADAGTGLDKLDEQLEELGVQGRTLWAEITGRGAPAMLKLVERMRGWLGANRELIQQRIGAVVERIATAFTTWIESGGFERLTTEMGRAWTVMGEFIDRVGGMGNVLKGLGILILAGPVMSLVSLAAAIGRLALLAGPLLFKALMMLGGPLAVAGKLALSLAGVLAGALLTGLQVAARAVLFLGRALLMNPVGLAVTAIAGAAYLIWKNWATLGPLFSGLWDGIKSAMSTAWESIVSVLEGIWNRIKAIIDPIISGIGKAAAAASNFLPNYAAPMSSEGVVGYDGRPASGRAPTPLMQAGAIQTSAQVRGDMRVRFENAPPGMRVEPGKTTAPGLAFSPDVGYRNMGSIG